MRDESLRALLHRLPRDEFHRDHLVELLERCGYARPDDRIAALVRDGAILKFGGGWYALGEPFRRRSLHLRWLSNIMRASVLSLHYALWHYGAIPEHVEAFTAVSPLRSVSYSTPAGVFSYARIPGKSFRSGAAIATLKDSAGEDERFFIATPAKALSDLLWSEPSLSSSTDWEAYLEHDIRLDMEFLHRFSSAEVLKYAETYASRTIASFAFWLETREKNNVR